MSEENISFGRYYSRLIITYRLFRSLTNQQNKNRPSETAVAMNNGECGMVAIAIYLLVKHLDNQEVTMMENGDHAIIKHGGLYYDTEHRQGSPDYPERFNARPYTEYTLDEMLERFMPCDSFGGYFIKCFLGTYGVELPSQLQYLIDKVDEFDRTMAEEYEVAEAFFAELEIL